MTALGAALRKAGIIPDFERLMDIAKKAVREHPRDWAGAQEALYRAVNDDVALLWALFEPHRLVAIQRLLTEASSIVRSEDKPQPPKADNDIRDRQRSQEKLDDRVADASRRSGMDTVGRVAALSMLDTFMANGRAIGDLTPREAVKWAGARERDAKFVRMLIANVPQDDPIRKWIKPDEANSLYGKAMEGND